MAVVYICSVLLPQLTTPLGHIAVDYICGVLGAYDSSLHLQCITASVDHTSGAYGGRLYLRCVRGIWQ